jgi:hypothetical protein
MTAERPITPSLDLAPALDAVLRRVRLRARRRIAWLRQVWQQNSPDTSPAGTFHSEVDTYLTHADSPAAEANWLADEPALYPWNDDLAHLEAELLDDSTSRLAQLGQTFGLSPAEADVVQACVAQCIDPNLGRVYAYLHDHTARGYVTEALVARLFGHGYCLPVGPESPLYTWGLVVATEGRGGEPTRLDLDPFVRNWLLGISDADEALLGLVQPQRTQPALPGWPVEEEVAWVRNAQKISFQNAVRMFVAGPVGSGRRTFAAGVADLLGYPLLTVDADQIPDAAWAQTFMRVQRLARLTGSAVAWVGSAAQVRRWPALPGGPLQVLVGEVDEFALPAPGWHDHRIELPAPTMAERRQLWRAWVPQSTDWPAEEVATLLRYPWTIGQMVVVGERAVQTPAEATEALREAARRRLGSLAQPLTSAFTTHDLVLPPWLERSLADFRFEAEERATLWEEPAAQRLFPQGKGLLALFTGPPGTGKTMAAQVIANHLHLDLFRIDLSAIVSKYVGETSKNIERILSRARQMNVVLLFDEADAMFSKRTDVKDAHDRFANTDTNYLLQAIEQYPGVAILTSNKKANIDAGFMRRLRYVLDFPKPDADQRTCLWQRLLTELAGEATAKALRPDLTRLATLLDLTGAQIKLAILSALFMARHDQTDLTTAHLLRGLERELMKEGRGLGRQVYEGLR